MRSRLLLIIPAYNEADNIERVVESLRTEYPQYDYVVVNDGSKDRTAEICRERGYRLISLPVNLGLAGAFQTGMKYAAKYGYEYAMQYDGDGQHDPKYIAAMLDLAVKEQCDIVIGSRFVTERKPWSARMLGSRVIAACIALTTGRRIKDPTSGMRMYDKGLIGKFANGLNLPPEPSTLAYLIKSGSKVAEIPAVMDERIGGVSYLTPVQAAKYMTKVLKDIWTNY